MATSRVIQAVSTKEQKCLEGTKIPLVKRNLYTGWPLLQISLYQRSVSTTEEPKYAPYPMGAYQDFRFCVPIFFFAELLAQAEAEENVQIKFGETNQEVMTVDAFHLDNLEKLKSGYSVKYTNLNITVADAKDAEISLPLIDSDMSNNFASFLLALGMGQKLSCKGTVFFIKPGKNITLVTEYAEPPFSEQDITDSLIPEFAIFENGQIYIDFGAFLEHEVKSKVGLTETGILTFFKKIFQVEEFNKEFLAKNATQVFAKPLLEEETRESFVKQLIELAQIGAKSTRSRLKKQKLLEIAHALESSLRICTILTKAELRATFNDVLTIALFDGDRMPLCAITECGNGIRNALRDDKYSELRNFLNIVISDEREGMRYGDLGGYLLGQAKANKAVFFKQHTSAVQNLATPAEIKIANSAPNC